MNLLAAEPSAETTGTTIDAAAFGLSPGAVDNTEALRKALAACAEKPNPTLMFAGGTYRFDTANFGADKVLALVQGVSNLTLQGNGAQFLLVGDPRKVTGLRFMQCKNVRIANLSVDCEKLPFSQGKIVSFEAAKKLVIEMDPKFPLQDDLDVESVVDCDPETGVMLGNIDLYHSAIESVQKEDGKLVVNVKMTVDTANPNRNADLQKLQEILPGGHVLIRQATYGSFMFTFVKSSDITLEDVSVFCFAGMAIHTQESGNITIRRFVAAPPKGSGRLLSITKDAIHITHAYGTVTLEDCRLEAIGDDGLNVYAKFRAVAKVVDPLHIEMVFPLPTWRGPTPEPGEFLNFWDSQTMDDKGRVEVDSATWDAAAKVFRIALRTPVPADVKEKDFISSEKFVPKVEVRRCSFRNLLARAMVFSTYDILVEDCKIFGTSYSGMLFPAGLARHGGQAPASRKVVIRNNVFEGTGGAAIYGYVVTKKPGTMAMGDILIEGNQIKTDPRLDARRLKTRRPDWLHWSAGICLRDAHGVRIADNAFSGYAISLYLENIVDAVVSGNTSAAATLGIINQGSGNIVIEKNEGFTFERDQKTYDPDLYYIGILR